MKNKITFLGLFSIVMLIVMSAFYNSGGSHGGKTGSPADGVNCTQCHNGTAQTATSWISSNIPSSGYIAGQTYTITLEGTHANVVRFGFELTAEDANNAKVGTFIITNATETKLVNNSHAVTHTGNGFNPDSDSTKAWSFDWTAPASGTGTVTLYAALLAANGNMSTSGDITYLTSTQITEDVTSSISISNLDSQISIYPSIATNYINVVVKDINIDKIEVYNINGQNVITNNIEKNSIINKLSINSLTSGNYFINFYVKNQIITKRFIKK